MTNLKVIDVNKSSGIKEAEKLISEGWTIEGMSAVTSMGCIVTLLLLKSPVENSLDTLTTIE